MVPMLCNGDKVHQGATGASQGLTFRPPQRMADPPGRSGLGLRGINALRTRKVRPAQQTFSLLPNLFCTSVVCLPGSIVHNLIGREQLLDLPDHHSSVKHRQVASNKKTISHSGLQEHVIGQDRGSLVARPSQLHARSQEH
jgi:hypothetical protein